jgi:hypothetical protein
MQVQRTTPVFIPLKRALFFDSVKEDVASASINDQSLLGSR